MVLLLKEYLSSEDVEEVRKGLYVSPTANVKDGLVWRVCGILHNIHCYTSVLLQACRCVQELEVPHFHHELVYEVS